MNKAGRVSIALAALATTVLITTATAQESRSPLWNFDTPQKPAEQQAPLAGDTYAPVRPPAGSNPGVLKEPELIARELNEDDAAYTTRMTQKLTAEQARTTQLLANHEALLDKIRKGLPIDDPPSALQPSQPSQGLGPPKQQADHANPRSRPFGSSDTE